MSFLAISAARTEMRKDVQNHSFCIWSVKNAFKTRFLPIKSTSRPMDVCASSYFI